MGEICPVSLCTGCTHEHFRGGLRSRRPLEGEVTPGSPLEEGAVVHWLYSKARSEPRDIGLITTAVHSSRQLSFISTFENTSQVAPGKSAEVLIVSRHLAAYNPRMIVPASSDAESQGADARMARAQVLF